MDAHVHLAFDAGPDPVATMLARDEQARLDSMRTSARQLVESGVTFARDLGAPRGLAVRIRDEIRDGRTPGPRMMVAGRPLTRPQGHCWFMGNEIDGPGAARRAVREEIEAGADLIKVMVTGGRMTPGTDPVRFEVSPETLAAVVDEAHRLGVTVAAHALSTVGVQAAAAAGVDSVEHGTFISPEGGDGYDEAGAIKPGYLADLIAIDGDPREDVRVLLDPLFVLAGGRVVKEPA
ncbi:amidohydrolase family protein [Streptosporangium canum]|uniref:amidohydrolase family protein n=1 Tax=Streptosporangium canum TaxID=324952 RepID=UPI0036BB1CEF